MARVIIEGLTLQQAMVFADWYEGQGEQDADIWFEEADCATPMTDVGRDGGFMKVDRETETVTMYCRNE